MSNEERKPEPREMTTLFCLKDYRAMLSRAHNQGPILAECPKCTEISRVDLLIEEEERRLNAAASENRTWIPVSERLPDEKGHYLTVVKAVLDGVLVRSQLYKPSAHKAFSGWIRNPVTHWMPLPEAPK